MNITYKLQGVRQSRNCPFDSSTTNWIYRRCRMLMSSEWDENQSVIGNRSYYCLQDLKSAILKQYNRDFVMGILIDKAWCKSG
jgi:hypothetical protein